MAAWRAIEYHFTVGAPMPPLTLSGLRAVLLVDAMTRPTHLLQAIFCSIVHTE
jgi:hypothetical protein